MVNVKAFTKLIFVGTVCTFILMLSIKLLDWHEQFSISVPYALSIPSNINSTGTPRIDTKKSSETPSSMSSPIRKRLPNCLIIGFAKCGTHALRTFLTLHPSVVAEDLELGFFNKHFDNGIDWYREHMPQSMPGQIIIEKTPSYILSREALSRMHNFNASLKLIILVRDPIVRMQSLYARAVFKGGQNFSMSLANWMKDVKSYTALIQIGNYAPYIRDVFTMFSEEQVLVLDGELLTKKPAEVLRKCEKFLNIKPVFNDDFFVYDEEKGFFCLNKSTHHFQALINSKAKAKINKDTGCFSEAKGREHPKVSRHIEDRLLNLYRATTEDLFHVIGERFEWTGVGHPDDAKNIE